MYAIRSYYAWQCHLPPALQNRVLIGDSLRLQQILINLLGNAVKFTEQGHVALGVEIVEESDDRMLLRFTVSDTGIGIPAEAQARIFAPFEQADGSTTLV